MANYGVYTLSRNFETIAMLVIGPRTAKLKHLNEPEQIITLDKATIILKHWRNTLRDEGFNVSKT
jgi:hypothetical protein